jgi:hypothetical protein
VSETGPQAASSPETPPDSGEVEKGRDAKTGRFGPGNKAGRGNPIATRMAYLRAEVVGKETPEDVLAVLRAMKAKALEGDAVAAKVYLERVIGPVTALEVQSRIEELEAQVRDAVDLLRAATQPQAPELRKAG